MTGLQQIIPAQNEGLLLAALNHFEPRRGKLPDNARAEEPEGYGENIACVLEQLANGPMTSRQMSDGSHLSMSQVSRAISRLHRDGRVLKVGNRSGRTFIWKLREART